MFIFGHLALIVCAASVASLEATEIDSTSNKPPVKLEETRAQSRGLYIEEMELVNEPPPAHLTAPHNLPVVRQNIYNYYNFPNGNQQWRRRRPYYAQPPPPYGYDGAQAPGYYEQAPYYPYNYPNPYPYQQQQQPLPPPPPPFTTTTTSTTTAAPADITPIGYMLVDNYRTPFGSFSKPIAFLKT